MEGFVYHGLPYNTRPTVAPIVINFAISNVLHRLGWFAHGGDGVVCLCVFPLSQFPAQISANWKLGNAKNSPGEFLECADF